MRLSTVALLVSIAVLALADANGSGAGATLESFQTGPSKARTSILRLDPVGTLPGLPVAFLVTLPAELVERAEQREVNQLPCRLHVTSVATGETFESAFDDETNVDGWIDLGLQAAPSAGMVEVQQPIDPPWGPAWFADPRLQHAGTYRLKLHILATELGMPEDVWSSEATLVVREPEGVDAEAWTWLRSHTKGGWTRQTAWPLDLMPRFIDAFPSSAYARYGIGILVRQTRDARASEEWLRKAIQLSDGTSLGDYYRVWLQGRRANSVRSCSDEFPGAKPGERRACLARATAEVREQLRLIAAQTTSPSIRHLVEATRNQLQRQVRDLGGNPQ